MNRSMLAGCFAAALLFTAGAGPKPREGPGTPDRGTAGTTATHALVASVIAAAGSPGVAADIRAVGSLGQPTPVGIGYDGIRTLYAGFWGVTRPIATDAPAPSALRHRLLQNAPNPFNPETIIEFTLAAPGPVLLEVYDLRGLRVRTLAAADLPAGVHRIRWDGCDDAGRAVASGVYCYRMSTEGFMSVRKMMLLK